MRWLNGVFVFLMGGAFTAIILYLLGSYLVEPKLQDSLVLKSTIDDVYFYEPRLTSGIHEVLVSEDLRVGYEVDKQGNLDTLKLAGQTYSVFFEIRNGKLHAAFSYVHSSESDDKVCIDRTLTGNWVELD